MWAAGKNKTQEYDNPALVSGLPELLHTKPKSGANISL